MVVVALLLLVAGLVVVLVALVVSLLALVVVLVVSLLALLVSLEYFQQDLNDPASTLMAIEETMRIMKEEYNTETNISIGGTDHMENV